MSTEAEKRNLSASSEEPEAKRERLDDNEPPAWARGLIASVEHIKNDANDIKQSVKELKMDMSKMKLEVEAMDVRLKRLEMKEEATEAKIEELTRENVALRAANEKLTDDSLRDSLSIHHIPRKVGGKETWSDTKNILSKFLAENSDLTEEAWAAKISRAHRGKPTSTVIHCLFRDWEYAQEVKEMFRKKEGKIGGVFVLDKFSVGTQERRNMAQARRDVERRNNPGSKLYIKYPAVLMRKRTQDKEYQAVASF